MSFPNSILAECADIYSGYAFKSHDLQAAGIPVIKIANIQKKQVLKECRDHLPHKLCSSKLEKYQLKSHDTLIAMTGAGSVGKVGKMRNIDGQYLVNQRVAIVRPDLSTCDPEFIYQVLSQDIYEEKLYALGMGAGQPNVSAKDIGSLEIPFPSLQTQGKIASILSAYDDMIENNTQRIKILEEMARMIYREWFVNFRFPGYEKVMMVDSPLGRIPEGWVVRALGDVYHTGSGGTPSRTHDEYYAGEIPWIKTRELNDGFILTAEEKITELGLKNSSAKLFPVNTVIIAMYGATIGKLGILTHEAATNQACCAFLPLNETFGYAYLFLSLLNSRAELIALGQGAAQQNISQVVIRGFELLVPGISVVKMFNEAVEPMLEQIKTMSLKNQNLRQTRDLLLPKLISGEIDLSNVEHDYAP